VRFKDDKHAHALGFIYCRLLAMMMGWRAGRFPWAVTAALVRMTCTRRYDVTAAAARPNARLLCLLWPVGIDYLIIADGVRVLVGRTVRETSRLPMDILGTTFFS